ncbi:DNA-binding protein HEXBP [Holothuria leucospilota]|uniref:DNA-binding protein HEXBP n=1 Tax=Holothuria leucospilota TaxID=206669 RepID=A0A9Q1BET8_HOLLE|nr:DNA-binding protein HEXBP [Holothuria leucospilota]
MDIEFNARDVISAISDDIGKGNILGCVKTAGQWIVTLKNADDAELLQAKSLPYAIVINGNHLRTKHVSVINCLSEEHLMRSCPQYLCSLCGQQGHTESRCPSVKCFRCQRLGHKSFDCPDKTANSTEPNEEKTTEEPMEEQVGFG